MATFQQKSETAVKPEFVRRVRQAIVRAATDIANEDAGHANHASRATLARAVVTHPTQWAMNFAFAVANNWNFLDGGDDDPATDSEGGDNALLYVVSSVWDAYAGPDPDAA